jgi:PhoPQ-activated pathogenicity-related protein
MNQTLNNAQHKEVFDLLSEKIDMFLSSRKKIMKCYQMFEDYPQRIASYYKQNFLNQINYPKMNKLRSFSSNDIDNIDHLKSVYIQIYLLILTSLLTLIVIAFGVCKLIITCKKKISQQKEGQNEPLL